MFNHYFLLKNSMKGHDILNSDVEDKDVVKNDDDDALAAWARVCL